MAVVLNYSRGLKCLKKNLSLIYQVRYCLRFYGKIRGSSIGNILWKKSINIKIGKKKYIGNGKNPLFFRARPESKKPPFCIIMPPPNANAPLHIGHAMFLTIEDIMARYARMSGKEVLLLPGADHAGILTQVVFEKKLKKEGKRRTDLKRNKFYRQCLKFTLDNKKIMFKQMEKMGVSCDWSREKFTLDKKISKQVLKTFVSLYKDKFAYRGERMINWCPRCATTLSDLEVEHLEEKSKIYFIKYPLVSKSNITGFTRILVVATTRPETMLGDTAIAVNPKDSRYKEFIGKTVLLPIVNKKIPVIADKKLIRNLEQVLLRLLLLMIRLTGR